jgi:DNA-binding LacI/PurR family transcriptional regulator
MVSKMKDVAERAGISITTVSHVLNKTRPVHPDTERRVLEAVRELNFHANAHARRLAKSRSDLYGLLISEIANPFFPEIIKGFQQAAWERGFDMLLLNTEYDPVHTRLALRKLIESEVRGVGVVTSSLDAEVADELIPAQIGVVYCNLGPPRRLVCNIEIDHARGIAQALEHLIQLGHRQVAVIAGPQTNRTAVTIKNAIVKGLETAGLRPAAILESDYKLDGGASAVSSLFKEEFFPTALFCGNDLTAMGAMSALEEMGLRVPEDVSVIGFDDIFFARLARPPLTTIHIPREPLGRQILELLDKMSRSKRQMGTERVLETSLVIRKSTAPPRRDPRLTASKRT